MKETLSVFTKHGTLTLCSLKIKFLFVENVGHFGERCYCWPLRFPAGFPAQTFSFGHAHRWPLM